MDQWFTHHFWADVARLISLISSCCMIVVAILITGNAVWVLMTKKVAYIRKELHFLLLFCGISGFAIMIVQFLRTLDNFNTEMSFRVFVIIIANLIVTASAWRFVMLNGEAIAEVEKNMFRKE